MSTGQLARNRALSMGSGRSSKGRKNNMADFEMPASDHAREFEPCDATASMFLYAQGNTVVCAHHDTLTIERRFSRHTEEVQLLAVDNVSDRGAGRLVISYDAGQTAIVWDLMTGDEVARFASYNSLSVASWMKNGNVAFGNAQGNIILFEPSTSEHISARTIDQVPVTALAPAADCRTYAIGYQNGSVLIASLQPRFTILHNLTTSRAPSPIVTLAWHASSSRQKSDMLAIQTHDGDLRVWSIAKSGTGGDTAKVVRVLKRHDNYQPGPNWLGWSKNGRIVQFSDGETLSWDVRTKNVTYESVPTLEHVRGIAIYGPGATMFTLGRSNTAQQFDLNSPPVIVANVQHPANLLPPSPPVSIEEQKKMKVAKTSGDVLSSIPINMDVSESDEDHMSPLARIAREMDKLEESQQQPSRSGAMSPATSQSSYTSRSSAGSRPYHRKHHGSVLSNTTSEHTLMSVGSTLQSQAPSAVSSRDSLSVSSVSSSNYSSRSRPRASRLRQEVLRSPEEKLIVELFKYTKSRLSDIPYSHPQPFNSGKMSNDELRRQMLSTIFGWEGEASEMIRDELQRHPPGSPTRLLLTKWLGDIDTDIMATSSESMTSSDWMLLALSGIGGQASQQKVARAYVQRLLEKGDVHTAATIMMGMGDQNDAIEIYVSHKRFMEALILTCHVYPADWGRQTQLIRSWGEWAVQHGQQQLAIRCFSCTATAPSEGWISPPPQSATFTQMSSQNIPEILSPPLSPPGVIPRGPQRNMAKTAALKLVTTFGEKSTKSRFFGADNERTPVNGVGVTPIAESALSPSNGDTAHTAFLRPSNRSVYHTPASARTATPGGFTRARLPSIGEMPTDVTPLQKISSFTITAATPKEAISTTSSVTGSETSSVASGRAHARKSSQPETLQLNATTFHSINRAATASPMMQRAVRVSNPLPSPSPDNFTTSKQASRTRNGSRHRKPDGLQIQWPPMESILTGDYMATPELSAPSSRHPTPTALSVTASVSTSTAASVSGSVSSVSSSGRSPLVSDRSYRAKALASPITGRSLDQYISSLESAQYYKPKQNSKSRDGRGRSSSRPRKTREPSEDRGRSTFRYIKPAKSSPTSPVPMSPEDLRDLGAVGFGDERLETSSSSSQMKSRTRGDSQATAKPGSKASSRIRRMSPEPIPLPTSRPASRLTARQLSRGPSPKPLADRRGRSNGREGSALRSPSSPLPMSPQASLYKRDEDDFDPPRANQERVKSRQRSVSRLRERGTVSRRSSPDKEKKPRERSTSRAQGTTRDTSKSREDSRKPYRNPSHTRSASDMKAGDIQQMKTERQWKKEAAARELEDRRRSLVRRPSAPAIMHPEQLSPNMFRPASRTESLQSSSYTAQNLPPRSQTVQPESQRQSPSWNTPAPSSSSVQIGLPTTPRAMQHPKYDPDGTDIPEVPLIPESYSSAAPASNDISYNNEFDHLTTLPKTSFAPLPKTTFTPLPKTTYFAAPRNLPPRSMSAPPVEAPLASPTALPAALPIHPAFHAALPPSTRRRVQDGGSDPRASQLPPPRKVNPGESQPGTLGYEVRNNIPLYPMGGIDETLQSTSQSYSPQRNDLVPPPPPPAPAPPIIKELQHLAVPPPPPPAPLYRITSSTNSLVSGVSLGSSVSQGSGDIEIVMDDDHDVPSCVVDTLPSAPALQQRKSAEDVPRPAQFISHSRGRSVTDNSISGRISRVTERLRSASRGQNTSPQLSRTKSPVEHSPYESVPPQWGFDGQGGRSQMSPPPQQGEIRERHPRDVAAAVMIESGMI